MAVTFAPITRSVADLTFPFTVGTSLGRAAERAAPRTYSATPSELSRSCTRFAVQRAVALPAAWLAGKRLGPLPLARKAVPVSVDRAD